MKNYKRILTMLLVGMVSFSTAFAPSMIARAEDTTEVQAEVTEAEATSDSEVQNENPEASDETTTEENLEAQSAEVETQATDSAANQVPETTENITEEEIAAQNSELDTLSSEQLVTYSAHQQTYGNIGPAYDGSALGTIGQSKRLEGFTISKGAAVSKVSGHIMYQVHGQTYGTQAWKQDGQFAGSTGQAKRVEALRMYLTEDMANKYDIYYRVHIQTYGWLDWVKGGTSESDAQWAGSTGMAKRVESVQIVLTEKGSAPTTTDPQSLTNIGYVNDLATGTLTYSGHQQTYGDMAAVAEGEQLGTVGQGKRLEAVTINYNADQNQIKGDITYRVHCQTYGWQDWVGNGSLAGTTGQAKRVEAISIKISGDLANLYDVYYRVHTQTFGWLSWAKNGEDAGTSALAKRIESIQIQLVKKGEGAPSDDSSYTVPFITGYYIMGTPGKSQEQMVAYYKRAMGSDYPGDVYSSKGAGNIEAFVQIVYEEATAEGVRPEVVFAQSLLETGYFKYGGQVDINQCNFAGIGATDGGAAGASFGDVREGIRAQVQHLKAYACTDGLVNPQVDPRFPLVKRGSAPMVEWLGKQENPTGAGWATGAGYGINIIGIINKM